MKKFKITNFNGSVEPILGKQRIRFYKLSEYSLKHKSEILVLKK